MQNKNKKQVQEDKYYKCALPHRRERKILRRDYERFYGIPKYDVKMIIGDFNAKIGKEEIYKPVIGTHSKHDRTNENGKMLIEFATERNMRIASTYFQHKTIHQGTWISPDGKTVNQIDHLLIEQQMCNGCEELQRSRFRYRSYTSESKNKIQKTFKRSKTKEYQNTVSNGKIKRRKEFQEKINKKLNEDIGKNMEEIWENFETIMREGAQLLTEGKRKIGKSWFDEECKDVIREREKARIKMINNNNIENKRHNEIWRRRAKNVCRKKKRQNIEQQIKEIEDNYMKKQIREFYQGIKIERRRNVSTKQIFCKNKGQLVGGTEESLKRWVEYFGEVYGIGEEETLQTEEEESLTTGECEEPPRKEEIKEIIKRFKNNKAPGENGITAEMLKVGGQNLEENIVKLINKAWDEETIPQRWKETLICPLHKKADRSKCENYRGIALMDLYIK
jgi:hypothetical protein